MYRQRLRNHSHHKKRFASVMIHGLVILISSVFFCGCSFLQIHTDSLHRTLHSAGVTSKMVSLSSGSMKVWEGGKGQAVLFLHGFGANAPDTWTKQLQTFAKTYHVIAPDLYWFGQSKPSSKDSMITPRQQAKALVELLKRLRIQKAHVVGVSFGGYVALELAMRSPQQVKKLVLVDAAGLKPTTGELKTIQRNFAYSKGDLQKILIPKDTQTLKKFFGKLFYKVPWIPNFVFQEMLHAKYWRYKAVKQQMVHHLHTHYLSTESLASIGHTTLVVWGQHDKLLLPSLGQRIVRTMPHATWFPIEKAGHIPMMEQPTIFNKRVHQFLKNQPLQTALALPKR